MAEPKRIQLSRRKGYRKPEGAIVVARPSRWGNPYHLDLYRDDYPDTSEHGLRSMATSDFRGLVEGRWDRFEDTPAYPSIDAIRAELRGHDLACWCPLVDADGRPVPCHADVLLELANR